MQGVLAKPRGFCAGVERAIRVVELALEEYGAPVYVRKEIVHNSHVVNRLRQDGAIFIDELEEAPEGALAILSAHGSPPEVFEQARRGFGSLARGIFVGSSGPLIRRARLLIA